MTNGRRVLVISSGSPRLSFCHPFFLKALSVFLSVWLSKSPSPHVLSLICLSVSLFIWQSHCQYVRQSVPVRVWWCWPCSRDESHHRTEQCSWAWHSVGGENSRLDEKAGASVGATISSVQHFLWVVDPIKKNEISFSDDNERFKINWLMLMQFDI